jgi:hypothetical protein
MFPRELQRMRAARVAVVNGRPEGRSLRVGDAWPDRFRAEPNESVATRHGFAVYMPAEAL